MYQYKCVCMSVCIIRFVYLRILRYISDKQASFRQHLHILTLSPVLLGGSTGEWVGGGRPHPHSLPCLLHISDARGRTFYETGRHPRHLGPALAALLGYTACLYIFVLLSYCDYYFVYLSYCFKFNFESFWILAMTIYL